MTQQNHPAVSRLPAVSSCLPRTDLLAGTSFHFRASHPIHPLVCFVVWSQGGRMVALPAFADIRLVDPEDEHIPEGSLSLEFLKECVSVRNFLDPESFAMSRSREPLQAHPLREATSLRGRPVRVHWERSWIDTLVRGFRRFPYDWERIRRESTDLARFSGLELMQQWSLLSEENRLALGRDFIFIHEDSVDEGDVTPPNRDLADEELNGSNEADRLQEQLARPTSPMIHVRPIDVEVEAASVNREGLTPISVRIRSPRVGGRGANVQRQRLWTESQTVALGEAVERYGTRWETIRNEYQELRIFSGQQLRSRHRATFGSRSNRER